MKNRPASRLRSWLFRARRAHARVGRTVALRGYRLTEAPTRVVLVATDPESVLKVMAAMAAQTEVPIRELLDVDRIAFLPDGARAEVLEFTKIAGGALSAARVRLVGGLLAGAERWTLLHETPAAHPAAIPAS